MKIGVMGAGAIGCYVGGCLAADGADVVFVGRDRIKREVAFSGLVLTDLDGARSKAVPKEKLAFTTDAASMRDRDVVFCCVKTAQTAEAAHLLRGVLRSSAIVVSMQNGLHNAEVLRQGLATQTVLGGIVGFNVVSKGAGAFRRGTSGPLVIEASTDLRVTKVAAALVASGFEVEVREDIRALQWSKLVMNLNNAVSAITDRPTQDLLFVDEYRKVLAAIIAEAVDVLKTAKVPTARLGALPVELFPMMLKLPTPILRVVARTQVKIDPEARSSMCEDLAKGRATEVDYLNGEIVRLAESVGARAPLNRRIVEIVHEIERRGTGTPKLGAQALWQELHR
ncbi:MAG: 2-dehydropantoate 2-reductase [Labilithrix sp.]|nr:2-dehydropantoate 2-reductase [Labilithrix sp.]